MKNLILLFSFFILISCSENKNQIMTKLINEERSVMKILDSLNELRPPFVDTFTSVDKSPEISKGVQKNIEFKFEKEAKINEANNRLKKIRLSIDSLSKMK